MDFSLGFLIPLGDDKKKTPEQKLRIQVDHFETLERRKLTKAEVAEIWEKIQANEAEEKAKDKKFTIKFIICMLIFVLLSVIGLGLFIYLATAGAIF